MLSASEITAVPEEQALIEALDPVMSQTYIDLPHHHYGHARDQALPEALRLDDADLGPSPLHERLELIAGTLGHDAWMHEWLDPQEGFATKEARTAAKLEDILPSYGFSSPSVATIGRMVISTAPGTVCETPNERKLRRADISNVGGPRLPFVATSVKIFYEETLLNRRDRITALSWPDFAKKQQKILGLLLSQDLSVRSEQVEAGIGPFNRAALLNVNWLSSETVLDPLQFMNSYGQLLRRAVPGLPVKELITATGA